MKARVNSIPDQQKIIENQRRMQQLVQQKNAQVSKENDERLGTEVFPADKLSTRWRALVKKAITKTYPTSHGISLQLFARAVGVDPERDPVSLFNFGVLNNSLEWVSPEQLELSREEYLDFMLGEVTENMNWWKDRVRNIRDEIVLQIDAELKMKNAMEAGNPLAKA